jgi:hypothetical protein
MQLLQKKTAYGTTDTDDQEIEVDIRIKMSNIVNTKLIQYVVGKTSD